MQVPTLDVDYWDESDDSEISAGSDSETLGSSDSAYCAQDGQSVEWRRADAYVSNHRTSHKQHILRGLYI